ncbi:fibronectin type III domain-containing protein (plasmid) [Streptomyces murinus]|uniref:fibronectin type III domain-containing protein n=1 Tax=Streptomyces murinus TaxID=33900 RepID=UPI000A1D97AC|nr:fibronectin type III domain-containing protein [Streptomyces murinus]WDO11333.1 fibronectin type III domain-containing protein [Streptomyces murinus]
MALSWDARLLDSDSEPEQTVAVHAPENIFYGLEPDTRYGVQVRAVGSMGESAWSETRWVRTLQDDGHEAPQRPETLAAHCITDTSAQVTWDNDPHVEHWTISVNGQAETTYNNGKRLTDLTPDTGYTVTVTAHQGDADSAAAQVRFTTLPEENDPETALPAPHDVIVRALSPTEIELTWKQNGAVSTWFASVEADWQERVDLRRHSMRALFGGLTPGATYTAEVYGQQGWDLSPVARQAVTLPERI